MDCTAFAANVVSIIPEQVDFQSTQIICALNRDFAATLHGRLRVSGARGEIPERAQLHAGLAQGGPHPGIIQALEFGNPVRFVRRVYFGSSGMPPRVPA